MNIKSQSFAVGDIITTPGHTQERVYMIESICLGALNQENVIELSVIDRTAPDAPHVTNGKPVMLVPSEMIEAGLTAGIFTHTSAN